MSRFFLFNEFRFGETVSFTVNTPNAVRERVCVCVCVPVCLSLGVRCAGTMRVYSKPWVGGGGRRLVNPRFYAGFYTTRPMRWLGAPFRRPLSSTVNVEVDFFSVLGIRTCACVRMRRRLPVILLCAIMLYFISYVSCTV